MGTNAEILMLAKMKYWINDGQVSLKMKTCQPNNTFYGDSFLTYICGIHRRHKIIN